MNMERLRVATALLITIIWAAAFIRAFLDPSFTPPPELSGIMLAAVTWLFGSQIRHAIKEKIKDKIMEDDRRDNDKEQTDG